MLNGISHKEWSGIPSHLAECQGNQSNEFFWITFPEEMGNEHGSLEIYPARYDQIKQVWHINGNAVTPEALSEVANYAGRVRTLAESQDCDEIICRLILAADLAISICTGSEPSTDKKISSIKDILQKALKSAAAIQCGNVNSNNPGEKNNIPEVASTLGLLAKNSHFKKIATDFQSSPLGRCDESIEPSGHWAAFNGWHVLSMQKGINTEKIAAFWRAASKQYMDSSDPEKASPISVDNQKITYEGPILSPEEMNLHDKAIYKKGVEDSLGEIRSLCMENRWRPFSAMTIVKAIDEMLAESDLSQK
ncbi:hypothetical protein [Acetobacter pasteurianus]|uniref:Uncharacterized protein n=1 Tax=Acetobacter pasteurianus NBRC 3188 TaxID=1226663 RepID=A0A401WXW9_ACEPA|nr:hypothetical protein [Acetobacter pasteurianus]GCD54199.1 hypothetical protein NBRC3188_2896 [Acetobacter pasteurianus NBRC 3188]